MITQIGIDEFLLLAKEHPVLDVRSPGEYAHAHIPHAYSLPLFSDEERKVVGTLYKQEGREPAIKTGLDYFGPKMSTIIAQTEKILAEHQITNSLSRTPKTVLVHCWRGGMRSAGVAWLLDLYGFRVYTLLGGYKAYRNWVLHQLARPYNLHIVGGYTGAGKTQILHELQNSGLATIDLEGIACHKGSSFGGLGEGPQPSQEMFENLLANDLHTITQNHPGNTPVWIEDESRRIGLINLPDAFWKTLQQASVYFMDVPFEQRLANITAIYGVFPKEELQKAILRIQKRLGGLNTKNAINFLLEDNFTECFRILLRYYDKYYAIALYDRKIIDNQLHTITCTHVDAIANSKSLIAQQQKNG